MIIRTHVDISTLTSAPKKAEIKREDAIVEEVKPIRDEEFVPKRKNNRKITPAPVVEETPVVEEDKIDLSEWLKEDIEE